VTPKLRRIAWHLSRDDFDADDLCQEAMISLCRPGVLDQFRAEGSLDGYLIRCGTRAMLSVRRTRRYDRHDPLSEAAEPVSSPVVIEGDHLAPELRDAMLTLPEKARVVVLLLAVGDLSYSETAEAVGLPIGTVRSTYARARERLQRELIQIGAASAGTAND
jgi:RNA polymerase sigma-70 factor (ECF subfamily)